MGSISNWIFNSVKQIGQKLIIQKSLQKQLIFFCKNFEVLAPYRVHHVNSRKGACKDPSVNSRINV